MWFTKNGIDDRISLIGDAESVSHRVTWPMIGYAVAASTARQHAGTRAVAESASRLASRASSATVAYISELELVMKSVSPSNLCSATLRADRVFRLRVYSTSSDAPASMSMRAIRSCPTKA